MNDFIEVMLTEELLANPYGKTIKSRDRKVWSSLRLSIMSR